MKWRLSWRPEGAPQAPLGVVVMSLMGFVDRRFEASSSF